MSRDPSGLKARAETPLHTPQGSRWSTWKGEEEKRDGVMA